MTKLKIPTYLANCLLLILLLRVDHTFSQEIGRPFVQNYSDRVYGANPQNWAVITDDRGFVYVGNSNGVLEYDGVNWRLIPVKNGLEVRSLAKDSLGTIYVGSNGEFGKLVTNSRGIMMYESLSDRHTDYFAENNIKFDDVWSTFGLDSGVIYYTDESLFRIQGDSLKWWDNNFVFSHSSYVNGTLYIQTELFGLVYLDETDNLSPVIGGENLFGVSVRFILPFRDQLLIGTENSGIYLLELETGMMTPWNEETNAMLSQQQPYSAAVINKNNVVIGTFQAGIHLLDGQGNIIQTINKSNGLSDNAVTSMTLDEDNGLWLATFNGVSRVEVASDLTAWNEAYGLTGSVTDVIRFQGKLYISTFSGVYYLQNNQPVRISDLNETTWDMEVITGPAGAEHLIISSNSALYEITDNEISFFAKPNAVVYTILESNTIPGRLYLGTTDGLEVLDWRNGSVTIDNFYGINGSVRNILEASSNGNLWIFADSLYQIFSNDDPSDFLTSEWLIYGKKHGLPISKEMDIEEVNGEILFFSEHGVFTFDNMADTFLLHEPTKDWDIRATMVEPERDKSSLWLVNLSDISDYIYNIPSDFRSPPDNDAFIRLPDMTIYALFPEPNGITWVGGNEGLFRHDSAVTRKYAEALRLYIREINVGTEDSIVYYGGGNLDNYKRLKIDFRNNSISIAYASPSFNSENENRCQVILEGRDNEWSAWSDITTRTYDNLSEGEYTFKVKARNVFGHESEEVAFSFVVLPPWYRSVWAYVGYTLGLLMIVVVIIWYNGKRLIQKNIELEKQVRERTKEILDKNQLLESQKLEISKKADDLRVANQSILEKSAQIETQRDKIAENYEKLENAMVQLQEQKELVEQKSIKLEEAQSQLRQVNSRLEQQVAERTQELNDAYVQLLEKNKELDMFIYRSAHDLKGPIARFLGLCYVGKMEIEEPKALEYLARLELTANEMNSMLARLIRAHDINQKQIEGNTIILKDLLSEIIDAYQHKTDINIVIDLEDVENDLTIQSDKLLFSILTENLIQNSFKYADHEKNHRFIKISTGSSEGLLQLEIIDNGVGIPDEVADNIFNMFFIGNEKNGGHGLGLYEARLVLEKLDGKISYNKTEEGFTRFVVQLPISMTHQPAEPAVR